jgi:hypothetical protein
VERQVEFLVREQHHLVRELLDVAVDGQGEEQRGRLGTNLRLGGEQLDGVRAVLRVAIPRRAAVHASSHGRHGLCPLGAAVGK